MTILPSYVFRNWLTTLQFIFNASEKNPFSSLAIASLFKEAGFPEGVVNFVSGGGKTGALLAPYMDIDKVSFTGSGATGRKTQDGGYKQSGQGRECGRGGLEAYLQTKNIKINMDMPPLKT